MITQGGDNVDLAAVAADDALLDLLAARAKVPADDVVAGLLAAFAEEVDDGLAALLASAEAPDVTDRAAPGVARTVSIVPALPEIPVRRGQGLRATTIALVVAATLSVSGVAAAVTGDPFAPYRGIVSAMSGGDDQSAAQAAKMAWLQRQLAGTRAKVAHGDLEAAQADLTEMRARLAATEDLSKGRRTALEARIKALEAALARAQERATEDLTEHGNSGAGPAGTPGPNNTKQAEPQSTETPEPQNSKVHQPQNANAPQPQNTRVHEPPNTQAPEPQNTKKATPTSTEAPDPASTLAPQSQNTKTATPQNSKTADSSLSQTAPPPGTEPPGNGNGLGDRNGNGNGHA